MHTSDMSKTAQYFVAVAVSVSCHFVLCYRCCNTATR